MYDKTWIVEGYPDFNAPFEIHTDTSKLQLGAVISQKGKPIAFYSRKMNTSQQNYTTTEKELLSIVKTLKEFRNILLGHHITVYTRKQLRQFIGMINLYRDMWQKRSELLAPLTALTSKNVKYD